MIIELNYKCESNVLKNILDYCKIKKYHIENEDLILPYEQRKFLDLKDKAQRIFFESETGIFKISNCFWINSKLNYKTKKIILDYKPCINKINKLLSLLNTYENLTKEYNFIHYDIIKDFIEN